jgi:hypothetical protein
MVIDTFDKSGDIDARAHLLHALCTSVLVLPRYIKLIITSHDEQDIRNTLADGGERPTINDTAGSPDDIPTFLRNEMSVLRESQRSLERSWPGPVIGQKLTQLASGLFIWASAACKFISDGGAKVQLSTLLGTNGWRSMSSFPP